MKSNEIILSSFHNDLTSKLKSRENKSSVDALIKSHDRAMLKHFMGEYRSEKYNSRTTTDRELIKEYNTSYSIKAVKQREQKQTKELKKEAILRRRSADRESELQGWLSETFGSMSSKQRADFKREMLDLSDKRKEEYNELLNTKRRLNYLSKKNSLTVAEHNEYDVLKQSVSHNEEDISNNLTTIEKLKVRFTNIKQYISDSVNKYLEKHPILNKAAGTAKSMWESTKSNGTEGKGMLLALLGPLAFIIPLVGLIKGVGWPILKFGFKLFKYLAKSGLGIIKSMFKYVKLFTAIGINKLKSMLGFLKKLYTSKAIRNLLGATTKLIKTAATKTVKAIKTTADKVTKVAKKGATKVVTAFSRAWNTLSSTAKRAVSSATKLGQSTINTVMKTVNISSSKVSQFAKIFKNKTLTNKFIQKVIQKLGPNAGKVVAAKLLAKVGVAATGVGAMVAVPLILYDVYSMYNTLSDVADDMEADTELDYHNSVPSTYSNNTYGPLVSRYAPKYTLPGEIPSIFPQNTMTDPSSTIIVKGSNVTNTSVTVLEDINKKSTFTGGVGNFGFGLDEMRVQQMIDASISLAINKFVVPLLPNTSITSNVLPVQPEIGINRYE